MRTTTLLQSGPSVWLALILIPTLVWFGAQNTDSAIAYWASVSAQSTIVLGFVSGACGAAAAWEAARLQRGEVFALAPARGGGAIVALHLLPVAVLGLIGIAASVCVYLLAAWPSQGWPSLPILGTAYVVVLSHIALGWLIGSRMPRALGAAFMLVFGYLWGFWPAALETPLPRHLNGQGFIDCCSLDEAPSVRSMAATVTLAVGVIAAAILATAFRQGARRVVVSLGAFGAAAAVSLMLAAPLQFDGDQPRDRALLQCTNGSPSVCLWPEQQSQQSQIAHWAQQATQRLKAVSVTPAPEIQFGEIQPSESSVLSIVATSPLPNDPPACALEPGAKYPGSLASSAIYAWLALTGGEQTADLVQRVPAPHIALAQQVRKLPPVAQHAWYERNMRSVRDCATDPDLSPSSFAAPRTDAP
ncbi:hypothetical protein OG317_10875 [Streptomyces sp. NBC_01167]|uniref:DUF7224 domain-containing protein n=1 Tax=Streptomyces sp. NBC_01167 TaxID=2903756 RepID=UPI003866698B|nr:hypothetical protein OG317_10875 [Streptomyces sp. NBC_01167]